MVEATEYPLSGTHIHIVKLFMYTGTQNKIANVHW